jgi:hypothetical protein
MRKRTCSSDVLLACDRLGSDIAMLKPAYMTYQGKQRVATDRAKKGHFACAVAQATHAVRRSSQACRHRPIHCRKSKCGERRSPMTGEHAPPQRASSKSAFCGKEKEKRKPVLESVYALIADKATEPAGPAASLPPPEPHPPTPHGPRGRSVG